MPYIGKLSFELVLVDPCADVTATLAQHQPSVLGGGHETQGDCGGGGDGGKQSTRLQANEISGDSTLFCTYT